VKAGLFSSAIGGASDKIDNVGSMVALAISTVEFAIKNVDEVGTKVDLASLKVELATQKVDDVQAKVDSPRSCKGEGKKMKLRLIRPVRCSKLR